MILRNKCLPLGLATLLGLGLSSTSWADSVPSSPFSSSVTARAVAARRMCQEMDAKVRDLRELFDRLELQAEQTKSQIDKAKPQAISFGSGEVTLGSSMAWNVPTTLSSTAGTPPNASLIQQPSRRSSAPGLQFESRARSDG